MNSERLTMHALDGACLIVNADNEQEAQQEFMDKFKKACNKLAELEDKLENGVLIELPCRVGDRLYRPVVDYISEETVMMITQRFLKNESVATLHTEYSTYDLKEMGDLYFLTKSEAEQKLKELKETAKLKPCPFCGAKATIITNAHELKECANFDYDNCPCNEYEGGSCSYYTIVCSVNNDGCGASSGYYPTIEQAINAWNRRAEK